MASLPESWGLKTKPRADGKLDIVGKDVRGEEYVARTTETPGVTERDLQLLSIGNRETSTAKEVVQFYAGERENYNKRVAEESLDGYMEGAEQVVHAGLHQFSISFSHISQARWDKIWSE
jgi:hypothetical protein